MISSLCESSVVVHPFLPVFDENSRILILGSLPSVKSREEGFYYGHPRNRFWKLLARIFGGENFDSLTSIEEKKAFLLKNGIALWDVVHSCRIEGSADSSIRNVEANNLFEILTNGKIERIFLNGGTAFSLFEKYSLQSLKEGGFETPYERLPSTSPANAAWTFEKLLSEWEKIKISRYAENSEN